MGDWVPVNVFIRSLGAGTAIRNAISPTRVQIFFEKLALARPGFLTKSFLILELYLIRNLMP